MPENITNLYAAPPDFRRRPLGHTAEMPPKRHYVPAPSRTGTLLDPPPGGDDDSGGLTEAFLLEYSLPFPRAGGCPLPDVQRAVGNCWVRTTGRYNRGTATWTEQPVHYLLDAVTAKAEQ